MAEVFKVLNALCLSLNYQHVRSDQELKIKKIYVLKQFCFVNLSIFFFMAFLTTLS